MVRFLRFESTMHLHVTIKVAVQVLTLLEQLQFSYTMKAPSEEKNGWTDDFIDRKKAFAEASNHDEFAWRMSTLHLLHKIATDNSSVFVQAPTAYSILESVFLNDSLSNHEVAIMALRTLHAFVGK